MKTILKLVLLLIGVSFVLFFYKEKLDKPDTIGAVISRQFEDDMHFLKERKFLPTMWNDLKEIHLSPTSASTTQWLKESQPRIETHPDGKYSLEYVLIDDKEAVMVQLNITDLQSKNKVWELSRIYSLTGEDLPENNP